MKLLTMAIVRKNIWKRKEYDMKGKVWIYRFLLIVGIVLAAGFIIRLSVDAWKYKMYALPFYYYIIFRVIEFLLPAIFLIVTGLVLRRNVKKENL